MIVEKCRYYNDHRTACSLMLDDLSNTATSHDGEIQPWNDWGLGRKSRNSLYSYLEQTLFAQIPELKGTFFYPIGKHAVQNPNSNWQIHAEESDADFVEFVREISDRFDLAFHGTTHGRYINPSDPRIAGNFEQEFSYLTDKDTDTLRQQIVATENRFGMKFTGGKYPGMVINEFADDIIRDLGFNWWTLNEVVAHRKHPNNTHTYLGDDRGILLLPMNIFGNCFSRTVRTGGNLRQFIRGVRRNRAYLQVERFLGYLYDRGYPITIQEHFQNQRTDGRRQVPNLFDDIFSVEQIYSLLRGADIWHATCSDIAHYLESHDRTEISLKSNSEFVVEYTGIWDEPLISVKSDTSALVETASGTTIKGIFKEGCWIYNKIAAGKYTTADNLKPASVNEIQ